MRFRDYYCRMMGAVHMMHGLLAATAPRLHVWGRPEHPSTRAAARAARPTYISGSGSGVHPASHVIELQEIRPAGVANVAVTVLVWADVVKPRASHETPRGHHITISIYNHAICGGVNADRDIWRWGGDDVNWVREWCALVVTHLAHFIMQALHWYRHSQPLSRSTS